MHDKGRNFVICNYINMLKEDQDILLFDKPLINYINMLKEVQDILLFDKPSIKTNMFVQDIGQDNNSKPAAEIQNPQVKRL